MIPTAIQWCFQGLLLQWDLRLKKKRLFAVTSVIFFYTEAVSLTNEYKGTNTVLVYKILKYQKYKHAQHYDL